MRFYWGQSRTRSIFCPELGGSGCNERDFLGTQLGRCFGECGGLMDGRLAQLSRCLRCLDKLVSVVAQMNNSQYEAPMEQGARERFWSKIAKIATASPRLVLAVTAVLVVLALVSLPSLRVSTSRRGLVEESNPYQQRLLQFFERFGDPNSPVFFVISGSTPTDRRHIVDEFPPIFITYILYHNCRL